VLKIMGEEYHFQKPATYLWLVFNGGEELLDGLGGDLHFTIRRNFFVTCSVCFFVRFGGSEIFFTWCVCLLSLGVTVNTKLVFSTGTGCWNYFWRASVFL
jgi:hypothetical protein